MARPHMEGIVDFGIIALRLLHVGGGILWAGGAVLITRFLTPVALELGPVAAPFMAKLTQAKKLTEYMTTAAATTVVAGSIMYWIDANGDPIKYFTTFGMGTGLGIGAIAAWIAFFEGMLLTGPTVKKLGALGAQAAAAGGPPSAELGAEIGKTQARLRQSAVTTFVLIVIAIVCMSTARYW